MFAMLKAIGIVQIKNQETLVHLDHHLIQDLLNLHQNNLDKMNEIVTSTKDRFIVYENNGNWFTQGMKTFLEKIITNSPEQIPIHYWNQFGFNNTTGAYVAKCPPIGHVDDLKLNSNEQQHRLSGIVTFYDRHEDKIKILLNPFGSFINCNIKDDWHHSKDGNTTLAKIDFAVFGPKELCVGRNR